MVNPTVSFLLAQAQTPGTPGPSGPAGLLAQFMPLVLLMVIMYLMLIRPQQKKAKEHREMLSQLKVGDKVVTNGGIHGTITKVEDSTIRVKVADKVELTMARAAVGARQSEEENAK